MAKKQSLIARDITFQPPLLQDTMPSIDYLPTWVLTLILPFTASYCLVRRMLRLLIPECAFRGKAKCAGKCRHKRTPWRLTTNAAHTREWVIKHHASTKYESISMTAPGMTTLQRCQFRDKLFTLPREPRDFIYDYAWQGTHLYYLDLDCAVNARYLDADGACENT
jgi:hypothetical protein